MIEKTIMTRTGKRTRKIQAYRCENGHFFQQHDIKSWSTSFVELVVFVYLNCLSLNVTINIIRAVYDIRTLSKSTILNFIEQVADEQIVLIISFILKGRVTLL